MSKSVFTEMRECLICAESKPTTLKFLSFSTCNHDVHTCTDCYAQQAIVLVEQHCRWDAVTCPACNVKLPKKELELLLPRDEFTRLDDIVKKAALVEHVNWRWCLAPGCGHGQTHNVPKSSLQAVKCSKCSAFSCFQHQVKWHAGYTCQQYDAYHPASTITKTDKEVIRTTTKACPHCECRIQKNGGCSHMECPKCHRSFFWDRLVFDGEDRPSAAEYVGGPEHSRGLFPVLDDEIQDAILEMEGLGGNLGPGPRFLQRPVQQQRPPGGFGFTYDRQRAEQSALQFLSLQETMNHRHRGEGDLSAVGGSPVLQEAPVARQFSLQRSPRHNNLAGDLEDAIERTEAALRHVDPSPAGRRERSLAYRRVDGSGTPAQTSLTADMIRDHHRRAHPQPQSRTLLTRLRSTSTATYNTLFRRPSIAPMRFGDDSDRPVTEQLDSGGLALFRYAQIRGQGVSRNASERQIRRSEDDRAVRLQIDQDRKLAMQIMEQENQEWGARRREDPSALGTQYQTRTPQLTRAEATRRNDESRRLAMAQLEEMRRSNSAGSEGPWVDLSDNDDDYEHLPDEEDGDEPVLPRGWMVPAPDIGRNPTGGFF